MNQKEVYDMAGIGIGPFNLGLAALSASIPDFKAIFFEQKPAFDWHPGLMLPEATLQVAYYADLVTLADPTNGYNYLSYLKAKGRMLRFGIYEHPYLRRVEYNDYCRWVAGRLANLCFGHKVLSICYLEKEAYYEIEVRNLATDGCFRYAARKLVIGIGSVPFLPSFARKWQSGSVVHSGHYLPQKDQLLASASVTIIGSGQSAAEIFYDLLGHLDRLPDGLSWYTRSTRFFPMDLSKLSVEMTSPAYIDYFYQLGPDVRSVLLKEQSTLYKGINYSLIDSIYDRLYDLELEGNSLPVLLCTNSTLQGIDKTPLGHYSLNFYHRELRRDFSHMTASVILATGYENKTPDFLAPLYERIKHDSEGHIQIARNYAIDQQGSEVFVQNAELATHGFNAPDLAMGPYRNAVILNAMLGYSYYPINEKMPFQTFGIPPERTPKTLQKEVHFLRKTTLKPAYKG